MIQRHAPYDIPFSQDRGRRSLLVVIATMVFLLSMVLIVASSLSGPIWQLNSELIHKITVEVPPTDDVKPLPLEKVFQSLKNFPDVQKIEIVNNQKLFQELKPWIGESPILDDLQLPILIDVYVNAPQFFDAPGLTKTLQELNPDIRVITHARWQHVSSVFGHAMQILALFILGILLMSICLIVILMTRTSLSAHQQIIDILRLMGARKSFIAQKFQAQSFYASFVGSVSGVVAALPCLLFLNWLFRYLGLQDILQAELNLSLGLSILAVPLIVAVLCMIVSRYTVMQTLARLDR